MKRLLFIGGGVAALLVAALVDATPAWAHNNSVTLRSTCETASGTYTISGTVANDWDLGETVTLQSASPSGAAASGFPIHVAANGSGTFSGAVAGTTATVTVTVSGVWSDGVQVTDSDSITLSGHCQPATSTTTTPPPPPPPPTTSTTAPPGGTTSTTAPDVPTTTVDAPASTTVPATRTTSTTVDAPSSTTVPEATQSSLAPAADVTG